MLCRASLQAITGQGLPARREVRTPTELAREEEIGLDLAASLVTRDGEYP